MSYGFGVSDFITVPTFAWKVYRACKDSSDDFKNLESEFESMHLAFQVSTNILNRHKLEPDQKRQLLKLGEQCHKVIKDLEELVERYESLGTQRQRKRDRLQWGLEEISTIRQRLISSNGALVSFNTAVSSSCLARIETEMQQMHADLRRGNRPASITSVQTIGALSMISTRSRTAWRETCQWLKENGISGKHANQNRRKIVDLLKDAVRAHSADDNGSEPSGRASLQVDEACRWLEDYGRWASDVTQDQQSMIDQMIDEASLLEEDENRQDMDASGQHMETSVDALSSQILSAQDRNAESASAHTILPVTQARNHEALESHEQRGIPKLLRSRPLYMIYWVLSSGRELRSAAMSGNAEKLDKLLRLGINVDLPDPHGWTALHAAAFERHLSVVRLLLEHGADANAKRTHGWTALHSAAIRGDDQVVQLLLKKGANINIKDDYEWTALHTAAFERHLSVVRLLLEHGADANAKHTHGWTALHSAAIRGDDQVVQLLLEKGADINIKDDYARTALHTAAFGGHLSVVHLLLKSGAEINAFTENGDTALYLAKEQRHKAVEQLLKRWRTLDTIPEVRPVN